MNLFAEHFWQCLTLLVLMACSAALSGSETALFSLSRHQLHVMRQSGKRTHRIAANLMADPRRLLATLLIGNNTVNVLLFAMSFVLIRDLAEAFGSIAVTAGGLVSLLVLVVFCEVIPKVISSAGAASMAPAVAPAVHVFQIAVSPIRVVLEVLFVVPIMRLIGRPERAPIDVTAEELKMLLDMSSREGVIEPGESTWLQQVVDLGEARAEEVMAPRVDVLAFDISQGLDELIAIFRRTRLTKLPVYEGDIDHIVGLVYARDALLSPGRSPAELLGEVRFVPEQMRLEQLLAHFRETRTQLAVVVDEYGGTAGLVTLEDVLEHIVGDIGQEGPSVTRADVEPLEDGGFSVVGRLSVRVLGQVLGPAVLDDRVDTIAGLFVACSGRIPEQGDVVRLGNLTMTVEAMVGRRIDRLRIEARAAGGQLI